LIFVGQRQRLNDRDLINDHQAIDADQIDSAAERAVNDGQKSEEKERDNERADGQKRTELFSAQVGE